MNTYNLINKQTGLIEFTGTYDECLAKRKEFMKDEGALMSTPESYYQIESY